MCVCHLSSRHSTPDVRLRHVPTVWWRTGGCTTSCGDDRFNRGLLVFECFGEVIQNKRARALYHDWGQVYGSILGEKRQTFTERFSRMRPLHKRTFLCLARTKLSFYEPCYGSWFNARRVPVVVFDLQNFFPRGNQISRPQV